MPTGGAKTVSTVHPPETATGTHVFDILGYSRHRGLGAQSFVRSGVFTVAAHDWAVFLYPDGYGEELEGFDFVSAYLHLVSAGAKARASCDLRLVDHATGASTSSHPALVAVREFDPDGCRVSHCMMMPRAELEGTYVKNDRLTIECVVTVRKEPRVSRTRAFPHIKVPGSDIKRQLADLLASKEGADVTFAVAGETFAAHRLVLAMRSPVFKAELCGPMSKPGAHQHIVVEDMQPGVFKEMLYFIYVDNLNDVDVRGDYRSENYEMVRHLLVAADRYDIERLKLMCQNILCNNLDLQNVATTLALADQHHFDKLKDACIQFMACSGRMEVIVATKGYKDLSRTAPSVLADAMDKMNKSGQRWMRKSLEDASQSG